MVEIHNSMGEFGFNCITDLALISSCQKSENNKKSLKAYHLPYGCKIGGPNWIFQQDKHQFTHQDQLYYSYMIIM